jgi:Protein of unknown function (DUF3667)
MPASHCLNCANAIGLADRFCPGCGQRTDTARLAMADVVRDLMHSFVNVERSPLAFAWALLSRPGAVAREFVEGKRRRHYGPFATFSVLIGATALAINLSGYQVLARDGFAPLATELLQRHFNALQLVQLPLVGVCSAIVFRRARLNLYEHLVLAAYALSVRAALLLVIVPISVIASSAVPSQASVYLFWAAWFAYFGWAASQFYGGPRMLTWAKGVLTAATAYGALVLLIVGGYPVYQDLFTR